MSEAYVAPEMIPARPRPVEARKSEWTVGKILGILSIGFWILAGIALVVFLVTSYDQVQIDKYAPRYWNGFLTTLKLVAISVTIGAALSLPIAFGRMSSNKILRGFSFGYIYFFRGTPLLAQLFLLYYGFGSFRSFWQDVGLWWFFRDAWSIALLSFSLNTAAYQAEILRGAIMNVPKGQHEGAASLGLPPMVTFFKIILPQALIVALRPYGNEIILMVKGSAVVSIITIFDLMGHTRRAFSQTLDYQTYIYAAIFYLIIVEVMRRLWDVLENRLTRHLRR
jgi:polar amino acid transport system permease protein